MDAQMKKIQLTPMKFNEHGDVDKEEYATLTFEVLMDSKSQKDAVKELFGVLNSEWVMLRVDAKQMRMNVEVKQFKSA